MNDKQKTITACFQQRDILLKEFSDFDISLFSFHGASNWAISNETKFRYGYIWSISSAFHVEIINLLLSSWSLNHHWVNGGPRAPNHSNQNSHWNKIFFNVRAKGLEFIVVYMFSFRLRHIIVTHDKSSATFMRNCLAKIHFLSSFSISKMILMTKSNIISIQLVFHQINYVVHCTTINEKKKFICVVFWLIERGPMKDW